jgi:hypothetical protein
VNYGFHRTPLVPSCLKALQYVLPCAVGAAQCRLSNEVDSLGCAAQYDRRARANAQLRIDWKVKHGYLTPSCGPSSIHYLFQKRSLQRIHGQRAKGDNNVRRERDQFRCNLAILLCVALAPAKFDADIAAVGPAQLL